MSHDIISTPDLVCFVFQFGDISKRLDQRAKSDISKLTGNKEYKFGDLSRWADSQIKEKVANYTGKENYQVSKPCESTVDKKHKAVVTTLRERSKIVEIIWDRLVGTFHLT